MSIEREVERLASDSGEVNVDGIVVRRDPGVARITPLDERTVLAPPHLFEKIRKIVADPRKVHRLKTILEKAIRERFPTKTTSPKTETQPQSQQVQHQGAGMSQVSPGGVTVPELRSMTLLQFSEHIQRLHRLARTLGVPNPVIVGVNEFLRYADEVADMAERTHPRLAMHVAGSVGRVLRYYEKYVKMHMARMRPHPSLILSRLAAEKAYLERLRGHIEKIREKMTERKR